MEKLNALIAAIAILMLVLIWVRTSLILARIRSVAQALADVAEGMRPFAETTHHPERDVPGDRRGGGDATRALQKAQEILAEVIGGTDGHEIETRAHMSLPPSQPPGRVVERRLASTYGAARGASTHYRSAGT